MSKFIATLKFTGVVSLGLLTGMHINFTTATLATINSLALAPQAQSAFTVSLELLKKVSGPLEVVASSTLLTAWMFAGRGGRHPYLLLTAAVPVIAVGLERTRLVPMEWGVLSADTGGRRKKEVNGEVVKVGLEEWRKWGLIRGVVMGVGFGLGVLGIWGDGA